MVHFYPLSGHRLEPLIRRRWLTASCLRHFNTNASDYRRSVVRPLVARSYSNDSACMGALFEVTNNC